MTLQEHNQSRRIITLGVGLIALAAAALLLVDQLQQTSATAEGPEMRLTISDPPDVCIESTCVIELEQRFKLLVEIVRPPGIGFIGAQSYIDFGSGLIYDFNATSAEDEIVWPGCEPLTALKGHSEAKLNDLGTPIIDVSVVPNVPLINTVSDVVSHGCLSGILPPLPVASYTGRFVEISVTCPAVDTLSEVILRSGNDVLASADFDSQGELETTGGTAFTSSVGTALELTIPKVSGLTIICGVPPTPTPTPSPTPCPEGKVPANGGCGTPRPTPTPCPEGKVPANGGCGTPTPTPTVTPDVTATPTSMFTPTITPTPTPDSLPCGDVNGDRVVNSQDALWVLWLATGVIDYIPFTVDLNGDGVTGAIDALLILQIEANLFICR